MTIQTKAYAKVNLTLDVLAKRPDGYHALRTVMAETGLFDELTLQPASTVQVTSDPPLPPDNTVYRAALLYQSRFGGGAHIHITKHIPMEAGLGGGSADAAATLRALDDIYQKADTKSLYDMAACVGSDVPFCLLGGLALCEGRGDVLTPLAPLACPALLVKGLRGVSTAALFGALRPPYPPPRTDAALAAIRAGDRAALGRALTNALEDAATALCPEIGTYKARLMAAGALGACMSGSGSAVVGLFATAAQAEAAAQAFPDTFAFPTGICYN